MLGQILEQRVIETKKLDPKFLRTAEFLVLFGCSQYASNNISSFVKRFKNLMTEKNAFSIAISLIPVCRS